MFSGNINVDHINDTVDIVEHNGTTKGLKLGDTLLTATAAEINARCDDSVMLETLVAAGAVSITVSDTALALVGAGAVTLAVPSKKSLRKTITMTVDNGDVTLALTNVVGQSSGTTCTFNDVGDTLVLVSNMMSNKWMVQKEIGVTLS